MRSTADFLQKALVENGFNIAFSIQEQFLHLLTRLSEWNQVFNLTAIKDMNAMIMLHLLDSLTVAPYLHGENIIDVGTGAGFPGLPLALIHPEKKFVLLDSQQKRINFLNQMVYELKLRHVEVIHARAEKFKTEKGFDSILTRAFAQLAVMLQTTAHLASQNGIFIAMKGNYPTAEIKEIPNEFKILTIEPIGIKGLNAERHVICITKKEHSWEK